MTFIVPLRTLHIFSVENGVTGRFKLRKLFYIESFYFFIIVFVVVLSCLKGDDIFGSQIDVVLNESQEDGGELQDNVVNDRKYDTTIPDSKLIINNYTQ